jgi:phosphoribosylformylglycinamidine synthase
MASKGGVGIRLDMNKVPCRETGMTPYEMMLSESQERMLMVLKPGRESEAEAIFRKWELDFAVIGEVTDTERMELVWNGETVADIPLGPLADEAPCYERPYVSRDDYKSWLQVKPHAEEEDIGGLHSRNIVDDLLKLLGSANLSSRRWVWEQYDQSVGADTVRKPGGDAAVVRVHGSKKALAITTDVTPRYCYADPFEGGKQAVAEAYRNLCAAGAKPLAITNCLNFGNPQRPEIMAQFVGCVEGMAEACRALNFPVVSGNVSLYNETKNDDGSSLAILPTPAIGGVGLLDDWDQSPSIAFKAEGEAIFVIGEDDGEMGQSVWLREVLGRTDGLPPKTKLAKERQNGEFVREMIAAGLITAAHDISDGGLAVAIAEMALAGNMGCRVANLYDMAREWFSETQGRYVVTTRDGKKFRAILEKRGMYVNPLGVTGGSAIVFDGREFWKKVDEVSLADLRAAHEGFFPKLMGSELTPEL